MLEGAAAVAACATADAASAACEIQAKTGTTSNFAAPILLIIRYIYIPCTSKTIKRTVFRKNRFLAWLPPLQAPQRGTGDTWYNIMKFAT